MKMQGTTRIKKRKGKTNHFFKRPDKIFTEKRRAQSNPNPDTKIDLDHNPD